jgi:hypothetical protein
VYICFATEGFSQTAVARNTMIRKSLLLILINIILFSCSNETFKIPSRYNELPRIGYCDLPNYKDREVIVTATYAGMQEYWSLGSVERCEQDLSVDFDTRDYYVKMPEKWKQKLNDRAKYFIVTAVGKYEKGDQKGYGHLNHLKSRFIVTDLLNVKVVAH